MALEAPIEWRSYAKQKESQKSRKENGASRLMPLDMIVHDPTQKITKRDKWHRLNVPHPAALSYTTPLFLILPPHSRKPYSLTSHLSLKSYSNHPIFSQISSIYVTKVHLPIILISILPPFFFSFPI